MSMTRKRAALLVTIVAASLATSTSALADGGECVVACRWYDIACIISQIIAGC